MFIKIFVIMLLVTVSVYLAVVFGGFANVAATDKHLPFVEWTLRTTMRNAVRRAAKDLKAPNLDGEENIRLGAKHYDEMCASCHAAPGKSADEELADGLNPKPPEIEKVAGDRSPQELFWVTKHGVKMTGMPAWGQSHKDNDIWAMVAFMRVMPKISPEEYKQLLGAKHSPSDIESEKSNFSGAEMTPKHTHKHAPGHEHK